MLAIVIPYFKLTFFEETLQSLANQTDKRFKVYIGDDASPGNPNDLLEKYEGKFDFTYHRFEHNLGAISLTKQWERCIALAADEEWIMILGDDDFLGVNVVEEFYKNITEIAKEGSKVIRFVTQIIDGQGESTSEIFMHPRIEKATDFFWRKFTGETRSSLSEYIFSIHSYHKYGFQNYPLAWHSDDMALLQFSEFKNILTISTAKLSIRFSDISISGRTDNYQQKIEAVRLFYYDIAKKFLTIHSKEQCVQLIAMNESQFFKEKNIKLFIEIIKWHIFHTDLFHLANFIRKVYKKL